MFGGASLSVPTRSVEDALSEPPHAVSVRAAASTVTISFFMSRTQVLDGQAGAALLEFLRQRRRLVELAVDAGDGAVRDRLGESVVELLEQVGVVLGDGEGRRSVLVLDRVAELQRDRGVLVQVLLPDVLRHDPAVERAVLQLRETRVVVREADDLGAGGLAGELVLHRPLAAAGRMAGERRRD